MPDSNPILTVDNLQISFAGATPFTAVAGFSFSVEKGKTLAIVGESGSGKSLTSLALMGLLPKSATATGKYTLNNIDLSKLDNRDWTAFRGKEISMVFQEPMSAMNPVMKIGKQLRESISAHQKINDKEAKAQTINWLQQVQLPNPEKIYDRYPHQLSGGQKQRVMIAMAMCLHPSLLIADEPTTALDVTVQKEVLLLMRNLQQQLERACFHYT